MSQPMDDTAQREREIGRRQALFREVNERIQEIAATFDLNDEFTVLCECGSGECNEQIVLSRDQYEKLRRTATHFVVLPGHEIPEVEHIFERHESFLVVEKSGERAEAADRVDPRRRAG